MTLMKMTNKDAGFYGLLGSIFGSRKIEKEIQDRIYDDDEKIWYLLVEDSRVVALISLKKQVIKNMYAESPENLKRLLCELPAVTGIVPGRYRDVCMDVGYQVMDHSKNFIKVQGGRNER